jgi:predicted nicotinamide N-methyase
MTSATTDRAAFVRAHTNVRPVPSLDDIQLHQADDAFLLWETSERELAELGLALPFWAFAWAGGTALARFLLEHPGLVGERRVVDLGTGSGLVAIAAARSGASHVTANDIDPTALAAVELNAALNKVTVARLGVDLLANPRYPLLEEADVVLAGDVAYEQPMAARMFELLIQCAARGTDVYIGDPGRAYLPETGLERLGSYEVPVNSAIENVDVKQASVWKLLRPPT